MQTDKKIIIALIAVVVIFLAGIVAIAPNYSNQNQTAYTIPLKSHDFGYFEMDVPDGSNFAVRNNKVAVGQGMVFWQNNANFSNETDGIMVSINYTDNLIGQNAKLLSENNSQKTYLIGDSPLNNYYKVVKSINGTDIIVCGNNLELIVKMLNTTKIKDTSALTLKNEANATPAQNNTTVKNETPVENTTAAQNDTTVKNETPVENTTITQNDNPVEKTEQTTAPVETTVENKTPVETVIEQIKNDTQDQSENVTFNPVDPIMIGGGSFTTGSADEDKTYARIYLGIDHAGEPVGIKIFYFRDGVALNQGNYVGTTIQSDGYVSIASADAYSKYPDFARVEVYNAMDDLISTQGINLNPTSGTQYF